MKKDIREEEEEEDEEAEEEEKQRQSRSSFRFNQEKELIFQATIQHSIEPRN